MPSYLSWQFVTGPVWLITLAINLQRALLHFFSVTTMLRTLFAHWHRDVLGYRGGTLTQIFETFAMNQISRLIGFIIRLIIIFFWFWAALGLLTASAIVLLLFTLWPLIALVLLFSGVLSLISLF